MRLLREFVLPNEIDNILLEKENGEKEIILKGIFAQAETKNRNNRIYPLHLMEREAYKLQTKIATKGLTGELDHPQSPEYNLSNSAIIISSYQQDPSNTKNFIGEAKVLKNTAKGRTLYELARNGIKIGLSTRSLGSLDEQNGIYYVKEDLDMITIDAVSDPSGIDCWAESLLEKKEFIWNNGMIKEDKIASYYNQIKTAKKSDIESKTIEIFEDFIKNL